MTINTDAPAYIVDGVLTDGEAWVALQTDVLAGDANSVTWTSSTGANDWSQYMDLVIITNANNDYTGASAGYLIKARFNDDSTSGNYKYERFAGTGAGTAVGAWSGTQTDAPIGAAGISGVGATEFGGTTTRISDINSGKWKNIHTHSANATSNASYQGLYVISASWTGTEAINKIQVYADTAGTYNFIANSRFDLWGVLPRMVS